MAGTKRTRGRNYRKNLRSKKVSKMKKNTLRRKTLRRKTMKRNNRKRNTLRRKTRGGSLRDILHKRSDPGCQLAYYANNNTNILFFNIFDLFAAACYNESFSNVFQGSNKLGIQPLKDGLRELALNFLKSEKRNYEEARGEGGVVGRWGRQLVGPDEKDPLVAFLNYWPGESTAETSSKVADFLKLVKKLAGAKRIREISGTNDTPANINDITSNFFQGYLNGSCGWDGWYHNRKAGNDIHEYIIDKWLITDDNSMKIIKNINDSLLINQLKNIAIRNRLERDIQHEERAAGEQARVAEERVRSVQETAKRKKEKGKTVTQAMLGKYPRGGGTK